MKISIRMRNPWSAALAAVQLLLIVVAVVGIGGYGWLKFEEVFGQRELEARFNRQLEAATERPTSLPIAEGAQEPPPIARPQPVAHIPGPAAPIVGKLSAERLGLSVVVVEGTDAKSLRSAAGKLPNGIEPGAPGNLAIAAHRDTYFKPLRNVRAGDVFLMETTKGRFEYEVEWFAVVEPTNVSSIQPTKEGVLTLITCFPFDYVGSAPRRFIVRAKQLDAPTP